MLRLLRILVSTVKLLINSLLTLFRLIGQILSFVANLDTYMALPYMDIFVATVSIAIALLIMSRKMSKEK